MGEQERKNREIIEERKLESKKEHVAGWSQMSESLSLCYIIIINRLRSQMHAKQEIKKKREKDREKKETKRKK